MVLDTVDGKLARCTGASSKWGNVFDHGIDLVHPPFWWWAWLHGLAAYGRPLEPVYATMVLWAIIGGYVVQRLIEGVFMRRFGGMHIHVWRPIDSQFRLITARRNPNMVILVAALLVRPARRRPGQLVALWTIVSLIFHAVRLRPGERAGRARRAHRLLARERDIYRDRARRIAARARAFARSVRHRPQGADPGRRRADGSRGRCAALAGERAGRRGDRARPGSRSASRDVLPDDPRLRSRSPGDTIASTILALCDDSATAGRCW